MKRIAIIASLSLATLQCLAYSLVKDGIYYNIISAGVLEVTHGDVAYSGFVHIPDQVAANGKMYTVAAIGDRAFNSCMGLTSLRIPAAVTRIGQSAFASCTSLHSIALPSSLREIGDAAFCGCTSLVSITLPASVSSIGRDAFVRCSLLERFAVDENNPVFAVKDQVLYNKQLTRLLAYPNAKDSSFTLPKGVVEIADAAFCHCFSLREMVLTSDLKKIGDAAFFGCSALQTISLNEGLTTIGAWAFSECESLPSLNIPASVTLLGDDAFSFCSSLKAINVSAGNAHYASTDGVLFNKQHSAIIAYPGGKGPDYSIPAEVTRIDNHAFYGCTALQRITLHQSVESIEDNPFVFCEHLTDINVSGNNNRYSSLDGILYNKEQTDIVTVPKGREGLVSVPSSVQQISTGAFLCNDKLQAVSLPQSVNSIGDWAFLGCYQLSTVNLPMSLSSLGDGALSDCIGLQKIICCGQPVATSTFSSVINQQAQLFVPRGRRNDFLMTRGWNDFQQVEEYGVHADNMQLNLGRMQNVPVRIDGTVPLTALQMDVLLPSGMHIAQDGAGEYMVSLTGENRATHQVSCVEKADGAYSIVVVSMDNTVLQPVDTLLCLGINIDEECPVGIYQLGVNDVVLTYLTDRLYGEAMQQNCQAEMSVRSYMGDVNHDGDVNVADVVLTLRHIQNLPAANFHFDEADVNRSGAVTVSDAVGIIDIIQGEQLFSSAGLSDWSQARVNDQLLVSDVQIGQGEEATLQIDLQNTVNSYTAQQFELTLPAGVTIQQNSSGVYDVRLSNRYNGHQVYVRPIAESYFEGNTYRIVCASNALKEISSQSGALLTLNLVAEEDLPNQTHACKLHHAVFADKDALPYELVNASFEVTVGSKTGIDEVFDGTKPANIYTIQGMLVKSQATSLQGLQPGVYIMNGRKFVVK